MIAPAMEDEYETIYTITDYYDGPRGGVANFRGMPHVYKSIWDDSEDDWSDAFLLQPISDEVLRLAMEDWRIWMRWRDAFHSGQTTIETHPALPADRERHDEIAAILKPRLNIDPKQATCVRAKFTVREGQWVVHWLRHENVNSGEVEK
jgi:hypothetical protein